MVCRERASPFRDIQRVCSISIGLLMATPKKRTKPLNYFFYRGNLCKKIQINRGNDVITAWNYPDGKLEQYVYSDVRKNGKMAFSTPQVQAMVGRSRNTVKNAVREGMINPPQATYGLDENRNRYAYYWSEEDIMALHGYLKTVHKGRPRKDGLITPLRLPTAAELRAMIRQGTVLYVKTEDGFAPTWQADGL